MNVILDTNVFLSGIFFGGVPGRILEAWRDGEIALILSPAILAEYHRAGTALAARYTRGNSWTGTSATTMALTASRRSAAADASGGGGWLAPLAYRFF